MQIKKIQQLIYKNIDSTASIDEARELNEYLSTHPEAANMFETQKQITGLLDKMPRVEPPKHLHNHIMAAIPIQKRIRARAAWWQWLFPSPAPIIRYRFAFGFVSGMAIIILVLSIMLITHSSIILEKESLLGTALFPRQFQVQKIDLSPVAGELSWNFASQDRLIRVTLNPTTPVTAILRFDPSEFRMNHFSQESWSDGGNVVVSPNGIRIDFLKENKFICVLSTRRETDSPIQFQIMQQDTLLFARQLITPVGNQK